MVRPTIRIMSLFKYSNEGDPVLVDSKRFRYRSEFQERLVANDYCKSLNYYGENGFIAIAKDSGKLLYTLPLDEDFQNS